MDARACILNDDQLTAAVPRVDETNDWLRDRLLPLIAEGVVPLLGGFIAGNAKGQTTTLGRGGLRLHGSAGWCGLECRSG